MCNKYPISRKRRFLSQRFNYKKFFLATLLKKKMFNPLNPIFKGTKHNEARNSVLLMKKRKQKKIVKCSNNRKRFFFDRRKGTKRASWEWKKKKLRNWSDMKRFLWEEKEVLCLLAPICCSTGNRSGRTFFFGFLIRRRSRIFLWNRVFFGLWISRYVKEYMLWIIKEEQEYWWILFSVSGLEEFQSGKRQVLD